MPTLPSDSEARKRIPLSSGVLKYFPAALAGVAKISQAGNDKHNPGEPLHHARGKSMDHDDCIQRHLMDLWDALAVGDKATALVEADSIAWRALALSQELHEACGAPLAPGAHVATAIGSRNCNMDCQAWDRMRAEDAKRVVATANDYA